MRNISETATTETTIRDKMLEVSAQRLVTVKKQISAAHDARKEYETKDGQSLSKDFVNVEALTKSDNFARFLVAVSIAPEFYINSPSYDAETWSAKIKLPSEAKTRNLKAYKKMLETAEYFANGSKLEHVLKCFVACCIVSSQYHAVIPRDVCERFLSSIPLNHVTEELVEAVDTYRAKHMSGGAATQTSQCTLQLATMRAADVIRNGKNKDFRLDVNSAVVESFAQRFGLVAQLERARAYRASIAA